MVTDRQSALAWENLIDKYSASRKTHVRQSTHYIESVTLRHEARYLDGRKITPARFAREDHEEYLSARIDAGISSSMRRKETFAMRSLLAFAVERKLLKVNVLDGFKLPRKDEAYVYVPSTSELSQILDHIRDRGNPKRFRHLEFKDKKELEYHCKRDEAIAVFLIDTGARIGEALKLERKHLDVNQMQVAFIDTKTHVARAVPISAGLLAALNEYLRVRPEGDTDHLFLTEYARPMQVNSFSQVFRRIVTGAGLPKITLHSIRHYTITEMAKVDIFAAMQKVGHRDLKVTQGYLKRDATHVRVVSEQAATLSHVLAGRKTGRKRAVS